MVSPITHTLICGAQECYPIWGGREWSLQSWLSLGFWEGKFTLDSPRLPVTAVISVPISGDRWRLYKDTGDKAVWRQIRDIWWCWSWKREWCSHNQRLVEMRNGFLRMEGSSGSTLILASDTGFSLPVSVTVSEHISVEVTCSVVYCCSSPRSLMG